jgi:hypothetical protein
MLPLIKPRWTREIGGREQVGIRAHEGPQHALGHHLGAHGAVQEEVGVLA